MGFWDRVSEPLGAAGRLLATGLSVVGRTAVGAYRAVDPDLLRHLAQLPVLGLAALVPGGTTPVALPDDGQPPIVCVPGLGATPGTFAPLRLFLRLLGRTRSYAAPTPAGQSLDDLAAGLRAFIAEVARANDLAPGARVDLVAHSMGGLVARLALEDAATAGRVGTLVTMGTPHGGSLLARYGATEHSLELRPGSPVMERLARQLPWRGPPAQPRLVALWSPADVIVLPATAARVEGAENVELDGFTHYAYLLHPAGFRLVARVLAAGALPTA
jgi:pimeloyl-ACP methyl ester carboxylesterase